MATCGFNAWELVKRFDVGKFFRELIIFYDVTVYLEGEKWNTGYDKAARDISNLIKQMVCSQLTYSEHKNTKYTRMSLSLKHFGPEY